MGEPASTRPGLRLALAGGGTGGHIVPGLHLMAEARKTGAVADLLWFTSGRPVEDRVLADLEAQSGVPGPERVVLGLEPKGGGAPSKAGLLLRTPPALLRARAALKRHGSEVLLGLGGFTALPAVLAARSLGIPCALLEVNAVLGGATCRLSGFARVVYHAYARDLAGKHEWVGPPLAPELFRERPTEEARRESARTLGLPGRGPLLVVFGGSQGARSLNEFLCESAGALREAGVETLHQCGPGRSAEGLADTETYRCVEYVDDVPGALSAATLVLCRGGASSLAELAASGTPAVVVPYPHHADQHQRRNAQLLEGGVRILPEAELGASLPGLLELLGAEGEAQRAEMTRVLRERIPSDSARRILAGLEELARERR